MSTTTPSMSRDAMDRMLEEHFRQEAEGDVAGTLATYTDDVVHDVVGDPMGTLRDQQAIGERYAHLFSNVKGEGFAPKHRLYGDNFVVDGDLTLHGVTRPVALNLEFNGVSGDPWGGTRAGFSAETEINRRDFGVDITMPLDGGGVVLGDKVKVHLEIEAVLQTA